MLTVQKDGRDVEVPRRVEAQGGAAIDAYVQDVLDGKPLPGVPFASPAARKAAVEGELAEDDFAGVNPSGDTGFTAADVRALIPPPPEEDGDQTPGDAGQEE